MDCGAKRILQTDAQDGTDHDGYPLSDNHNNSSGIDQQQQQ
jgi:hypothetical protein